MAPPPEYRSSPSSTSVRPAWSRRRQLAVSFGVSSLVVYLLGPTVKAAGFGALLRVMAGISAFTTLCVALLPGRIPMTAPVPLTAVAAPQR